MESRSPCHRLEGQIRGGQGIEHAARRQPGARAGGSSDRVARRRRTGRATQLEGIFFDVLIDLKRETS
jgi:hypothetical protein